MKRVAIIGGGLAGLTCAYALKQRGINAVVFEASATPAKAGRATNVHRMDGFTFDVGAQYLLRPELFRETFGLIRTLGLSNDVIAIPPNAGQFYKGKVYRHRVASATGLLKFKGLGIADKAMLPRMAYLLAKYGPEIDFHHPERGITLDDETVATFVKRELSQNILNYVAGPLISSLCFYGSEETSKLLFLMLAKHMYHTQMYTIRGGIGRIHTLLSQEAAIRDATIREIGTSNTGYEVEGEPFSDVVFATTGDAVLKIQGVDELLSDEDRQFFTDCKYQRVVTMVAGTDKPLHDGYYALTIPRVEKLTASAIAFQDYLDPSRAPEGKGLLAITGGGPAVTEKLLAEDLNRIYQSGCPLFVTTYDWTSATPRFPPGRFRQIAAFQQRKRRPGLWFAGDYLLGPFVEGAIVTALRTAAGIPA